VHYLKSALKGGVFKSRRSDSNVSDRLVTKGVVRGMSDVMIVDFYPLQIEVEARLVDLCVVTESTHLRTERRLPC